mgnify:FL=1
MSKEIILHKDQSSIFDIVEDTTTPMPIIVKEQSINLKLSSLLALKDNVKLRSELINALECDELNEVFIILSKL